MAIQLPVVNRTAPVATAPTPKTDVNIPNFEKPMEAQNADTEKLANQFKTFQEAKEDQAIDVMATQKANDYNNFVNEQLEGPNGLKYQQGDPTAAYQNFKDTIDKKVDEYFSDDNNLSDRARITLASKLQEVRQKTYYKGETIYGANFDTYATKTNNDAVGLEKQGLTDAGAYIVKDDPNSLTQFDLGVQKIIDLRFKNGERVGTVTKDADGNYIPNPSVQLQLSKDLSDGITQSIENLTASGKTDEAQMLQEKYSKYIDPVNRKKVTKGLETASKKNAAYSNLDNIIDLPEEKALKKIEDIDDPEVRQTTEKLYNDHLHRKSAIIANSSKTNYNDLANYIQQKQKSSSPFVSVTDMENDNYIAKVLPKVTDPKQRKALESAVSQPKESNVDAKSAAYNSLFAGNFQGMSPEDFNQTVAGLNKADRSKLENKWSSINSESSGEQNRKIKFMGSQLTEQMQKLGLVKKNQYGKYDNATQVKILNAQDQMEQAITTFPPGLSPEKQQEWVKNYAVTLKTGEVFKPPQTQVAPPKPKVADISKNPGVTPSTLDLDAKKQWIRQFRADKGRSPDLNTTELQDYIKGHK